MRIAWPGPARITVVALAAVPATMAYPWRTGTERWTLGTGVVVAILLLAYWRGRHLTTILRRRLAMLRRPGAGAVPDTMQSSGADAKATVALRILDDSGAALPLKTLGGYLERYGVRCDGVRITSRDTAAGRSTWVSLTLSAAANLAALQARSSALPLRETAEVVARRLADHLRELGLPVTTVDLDVPDLLGPVPKERWRGVQDGQHGYLAAYAVPVDDGLDVALAAVGSLGAAEVWTAVEITGPSARPELAVACAIRTRELPAAPPPNLVARDGDQWAAVTALHPLSSKHVLAQRIPLDEALAIRT